MAEFDQTPPGGAPGMDALINPPPEVAQAMRPPADTTEFQQRVSVWQQFQERLKADPNLQSMLIRFGTAMMQPRQQEQSVAGHIGQAVNTGMNFYQAGIQNTADEARRQEETRLKGEELSVRRGESAARVAESGARTKQIGVQTDVMERELPGKLRQLEAQIRGTEATANYHGALAEFNQIKAELERRFGPQEAAAKLTQMGADAIYKEALAGYHRTHSQVMQTQMDQGRGWQPGQTKIDDQTGMIISESTNRSTGERQRIITHVPIPLAEASARAKADVNAVIKATSGSWFGTSKEQTEALSRAVGQPVANEKEAVRVLTERYNQGHTTVTNIKPDGSVMSRRHDSPVTAVPGETEADARTRAIAAHQTNPNQTIDVRPGPQTPSGQIPLATLQAEGWRPGLTGTVQVNGQSFRVDARGNASPVQPVAPAASTTPAGVTLAIPTPVIGGETAIKPSAVTPPPQPAALPPEVEKQLLSPLLGGAIEIKIPSRIRGGGADKFQWARALDGTTYRSREEALAALRNLYGK